MSQVIKCPNCGAENRVGAKFCSKCRAELPRTTGKIQSTTPPSTGVQLNAPTPPRAPASATSVPRVSSQTSPNAATVRLSVPGFDNLPVRAIVNGRYEVLEFIGKPGNSANINVYRVKELASNVNWTLFEARDANRFRREAEFAKRNLNHAGLVKFREAFEWTPYAGQRRGYLVSEQQQTPLTSVQGIGDYQPLQDFQLAKWGEQLADALAYLHNQKIYFGEIRQTNLVAVNNQAKFTDLGAAHPLPPEAGKQTVTATIAQDIRSLVNALWAYAGQVKAGVPLAPPLAAVFQRALKSSNPYATAAELKAGFQQAAEMIRQPSRARFISAHGWNVGQKREINEDSYLAWEVGRSRETNDKPYPTGELDSLSRALGQPLGLYLVADGLGGAAAGEVASRLAVDTVVSQVVNALGSRRPTSAGVENPVRDVDWGTVVQGAVEGANRAIQQARQDAHNDMGTTLVGALVLGYQAYIVNVGDSRAYLLGRDGLRRISRDHSLVQVLVDSGQIRDEERYTHPQRNLILRNLGDRATVEIDQFTKALEPGDCLILCSDGLWEMVRDADMQRIVANAPNPAEACNQLVKLANENGGDDNITVIVLQVEAVK